MEEQVSIGIASRSADTGSGNDVVVNAGRTFDGWETVEVTLRAEGFPPTFRIAASSGMPTGTDAAFANAGDACFVRFGDDLVITGYLTSLLATASSGAHNVEIVGAGKTQDFIGEIDWDTARAYLNPTIEAVETIAAVFGVEFIAQGDAATPLAGDTPNLADYPILLDYGTSAAEYVNQITRIMGLLAYEDSEGRLVLSRAGTASAASGAVYGQNVEEFAVTNSVEARFSEIVACRFRQNQFLEGTADTAVSFHTAKDPGVTRHRVKHVFVANGPDGEQFAQRLADWEVARRAARGREVRVTVDSWRDSAGKLWRPNTIIPLDLPGLATGAGPFGLSEVTFRRNDATGTTAEMLLYPMSGFTPEPVQPTSANLIGIAGTDGG